MKMNVIGVQQHDYISKKDNRPVRGVSLHCSFDDAMVDGQAVDSLFISDRLECFLEVRHVKPGDVVDVEYGRRGYIADVTIIPRENPASSPAPAPGQPKK